MMTIGDNQAQQTRDMVAKINREVRQDIERMNRETESFVERRRQQLAAERDRERQAENAAFLRWAMLVLFAFACIAAAISAFAEPTTQGSEPTAWWMVWTPDKIAYLIGIAVAAWMSFRAGTKADTAQATAKDAHELAVTNVGRIIDVKGTASEAKGMAQSASTTADAAQSDVTKLAAKLPSTTLDDAPRVQT